MVSTSRDILASGLSASALILRPESAIQATERLEQMSHHCRYLLNLPNNEAFRRLARDRCIGSLLSQLVDLGYGLTRVGKRVPSSSSPWREYHLFRPYPLLVDIRAATWPRLMCHIIRKSQVSKGDSVITIFKAIAESCSAQLQLMMVSEEAISRRARSSKIRGVSGHHREPEQS